ncbi:MAG: 30S ribosomal protein S21 [bacterium]|nr:30S ribosomal protein S21 [bacterium]
MPIEVKKKEGESASSLLRRFSKRVQQSGVLIRARKGRFYLSEPTKRQKRLGALRRLKNKKEREKLYKLGKLPPEKKFRR